MMDKENKLILYKDDEGRVSVNTRFADEDVWLTQAQLVEIYQSSKSNISEHIKHIFEDKELDENVAHYNLDVIIALGYRVQSPIAVRFRRWATQRLRKNILEGSGSVSHQEAIEKAEREFEIYREREMRLLESDFDKAVKRLRNKNSESTEDTKDV